MDLRKYLVKKRTRVSNSSEESDSDKHEGESLLADDITLPSQKENALFRCPAKEELLKDQIKQLSVLMKFLFSTLKALVTITFIVHCLVHFYCNSNSFYF